MKNSIVFADLIAVVVWTAYSINECLVFKNVHMELYCEKSLIE